MFYHIIITTYMYYEVLCTLQQSFRSLNSFYYMKNSTCLPLPHPCIEYANMWCISNSYQRLSKSQFAQQATHQANIQFMSTLPLFKPAGLRRIRSDSRCSRRRSHFFPITFTNGSFPVTCWCGRHGVLAWLSPWIHWRWHNTRKRRIIIPQWTSLG